MRNRVIIATVYAHAYKHRAKQVATTAKEFVGEHKSEMARTAATSAVVYVASRAAGFRAGYEFASNN